MKLNFSWLLKRIKKFFKRKECDILSDFSSMNEYYNQLSEWDKIYKGQGDWVTVRKGGLSKGTRKMKKINAAKILCAEFCNLTFSEQVNFSISDEALQEYVLKVLKDNAFWKNFPILLESCFALGGAAVNCYLYKGEIKLDCVPATKFIPIKWNNKRITSGAFVSKITKDDRYYTLVELHIFENGTESIYNKIFQVYNEMEEGREMPLTDFYEDLQPFVQVQGLEVPLFSYMRPNTANNLNPDCPLGASVFANCTDTIEAIDVAFDSFQREFTLGKKRIIVPAQAINTVIDNNGEEKRYFDLQDEVFCAFNFEDTENLKITDNTMELRIEEHVSAINALLNILCTQTGLSVGTITFDNIQGMKTATEVISQDSKTYRTVAGHQNIIRETIAETVKSIISLGAFIREIPVVKDYELSVMFDDSIMTDKNADIDNAIKLTAAGLQSKKDAIMKIFGYDEETAERKSAELKNETPAPGSSFDYGGMFR